MIAWVLTGLFTVAGGEDRRRTVMHPMTESVVIKAAEVHVGDGRVYRPGVIVLLGSEVLSVGTDPALPLSPRIVDLGDAIVTPGLIDAACQLGPHQATGFAEQTSEVIPHLDVADSINFESDALEILAREGVTSIYVTPEAASVIGTRGAIIKTGGQGVSRIVEVSPTIKVNIGPESVSRGGRNSTPSNFRGITFMTRRPTTRMGAVWVFRKAFYDAIRVKSGLDSDGDPEAMAALVEVLSGQVGIRFQARKAHDIQTAQRLCAEFGVKHVIEYGHEAFRCMETLVANQTPVIYGPIYISPIGVSRSGDAPQPCLGTTNQLRDAGVKFCLTACDLTGEDGLARQAGKAFRHGLSLEEAMATVTSTAADILGVSDRLGTLTRGRDADLVVWNGAPFADTSKVTMTLIDGHPVHDPDGLFEKQ